MRRQGLVWRAAASVTAAAMALGSAGCLSGPSRSTLVGYGKSATVAWNEDAPWWAKPVTFPAGVVTDVTLVPIDTAVNTLGVATRGLVTIPGTSLYDYYVSSVEERPKDKVGITIAFPFVVVIAYPFMAPFTTIGAGLTWNWWADAWGNHTERQILAALEAHRFTEAKALIASGDGIAPVEGEQIAVTFGEEPEEDELVLTEGVRVSDAASADGQTEVSILSLIPTAAWRAAWDKRADDALKAVEAALAPEGDLPPGVGEGTLSVGAYQAATERFLAGLEAKGERDPLLLNGMRARLEARRPDFVKKNQEAVFARLEAAGWPTRRGTHADCLSDAAYAKVVEERLAGLRAEGVTDEAFLSQVATRLQEARADFLRANGARLEASLKAGLVEAGDEAACRAALEAVRAQAAEPANAAAFAPDWPARVARSLAFLDALKAGDAAALAAFGKEAPPADFPPVPLAFARLAALPAEAAVALCASNAWVRTDFPERLGDYPPALLAALLEAKVRLPLRVRDPREAAALPWATAERLLAQGYLAVPSASDPDAREALRAFAGQWEGRALAGVTLTQALDALPLPLPKAGEDPFVDWALGRIRAGEGKGWDAAAWLALLREPQPEGRLARVWALEDRVGDPVAEALGDLALAEAAIRGNPTLAAELFRRGRLHAATRLPCGRTALALIVERGQNTLLGAIPRGEIRPDAYDASGLTPLGWALQGKNLAAARFLIETCGGDPTVPPIKTSSESALALARRFAGADSPLANYLRGKIPETGAFAGIVFGETYVRRGFLGESLPEEVDLPKPFRGIKEATLSRTPRTHRVYAVTLSKNIYSDADDPEQADRLVDAEYEAVAKAILIRYENDIRRGHATVDQDDDWLRVIVGKTLSVLVEKETFFTFGHGKVTIQASHIPLKREAIREQGAGAAQDAGVL